MVDLLAPDAPHDVALLGDAAVQDSELRSPLRRYERTHAAHWTDVACWHAHVGLG